MMFCIDSWDQKLLFCINSGYHKLMFCINSGYLVNVLYQQWIQWVCFVLTVDTKFVSTVDTKFVLTVDNKPLFVLTLDTEMMICIYTGYGNDDLYLQWFYVNVLLIVDTMSCCFVLTVETKSLLISTVEAISWCSVSMVDDKSRCFVLSLDTKPTFGIDCGYSVNDLCWQLILNHWFFLLKVDTWCFLSTGYT